MKILMLGSKFGGLTEWLGADGNDVVTREAVAGVGNIRDIGPDFIISYNYRHLLPKEVIRMVDGRAINLHISFLPYNRGTFPNVWSFLENTPKGVTIHYMDERIDTGDIIAQKEVSMDEGRETLSSSYWRLHLEIQALFKEVWKKIAAGEVEATPQKRPGTVHYAREYWEVIEPLIYDKGWDIQIPELKRRYREFNDHSAERVLRCAQE